MSSPQPSAQGNLAQTPLAHVLLSIASKQMSGTLALWPDPDEGGGGQDRILFNRGEIVAVLLLERASEDLMRGLLPLFRRQQAPYAFYVANLVSGATAMQQGTVDVFALVAASLRGGARADVVDQVLASHGEEHLRIQRNIDFRRFGFIAKEQAFLELLRAEPQTVAQLLQRAGDQRLARRMIYLLSITQSLASYEAPQARAHAAPRVAAPKSAAPKSATNSATKSATPDPRPPAPRHVEPKSAPAAPEPDSAVVQANSATSSESIPPMPRELLPPAPPPPPPNDLAPELRQRWMEIRAKHIAMDGETYFQVLGVSTSATSEDIRKAYFAEVKKWHPDRLPPELEPVRGASDDIFKYLTDAQTTLLDTEKRGPYLKSVQGGAGTPKMDREAQAVLTAAMEFQKVEVLISRKRWSEARKILNMGLRLDPENPEYLAAKGEILWHEEGSDRIKDVIALLDRALENSPRSLRALLTKATILEKQNKPKAALGLYKRALEVQPRNVEAQRMVRLLTMRSKGAAASAKKSESEGMFGRLFKKK